LRDLAEALGAAHAAGVLHGDLKPSNVILRPDGHAVVTDFGLSSAWAAGAPRESSSAYMAAERILGKASPTADVYSFGAVAFEAAAGRRPHQGESARQLLAARLARPPPPLQTLRPDLPAALCRLVDRCLAPLAADRIASGVELRAEAAWEEA